jgi:hypothetical protein
MALPPFHRADHEPRYIMTGDTAWRSDLIESDLAEWAKQGLDRADHPIERYRSGASRADLATVERYVDRDLAPTVFVFARLPHALWCAARNATQRNAVAGISMYLAHSLVGIENGIALGRGGVEGGPLVADDHAAIRQWVGDDAWDELAWVAVAVNRELGPAEKKPSGSTPGG